jgi:hypothetical protein
MTCYSLKMTVFTLKTERDARAPDRGPCGCGVKAAGGRVATQFEISSILSASLFANSLKNRIAKSFRCGYGGNMRSPIIVFTLNDRIQNHRANLISSHRLASPLCMNGRLGYRISRPRSYVRDVKQPSGNGMPKGPQCQKRPADAVANPICAHGGGAPPRAVRSTMRRRSSLAATAKIAKRAPGQRTNVTDG